MKNTIFALATPPLTSALAIIRVSGDKSLEILQNIFSKKVEKLENGKVIYGFIIDQDRKIDEVLVMTFKGPKSFTGEDMFEVSCHGGLVIIDEIIKLLIKQGAKLAEKGEFTRRAFYNNKLDLIQAESINDLIHSTSVKSKEIALNNLDGKVSSFLNKMDSELSGLIAQINVNIDYPEYKDIEELTSNLLLPKLKEILELLKSNKDNSLIGKMINEGVKVAIVGKPNVGKSTLLNALIKRDKAITSDIPGTTRDIVEGSINLSGITFHFLDTAGIRNTEEKIEQIGIKKSYSAIEIADIVIVLLDDDNIDEEAQTILNYSKTKKRIIVRNKKDLMKKQSDYLSISASCGDVQNLEEALIKLIQNKSFENESLLTNSRQIGELEKAITSLEIAISECHQLVPTDLIVLNINLAQEAIRNILGITSDNNIENEVFSRFCVGK